MKIEFNGQVAVVTGGVGGIGMACVRELAASGAQVAVLDRACPKLDALTDTFADVGKVRGFALDLSDPASITAAVGQVRREMGEIRVLVQCAGLMGGKPGLEVTPEDWDRAQNVNARGSFFMRQHCELRLHGWYPGHASADVLRILLRIQRGRGRHDHAGGSGMGIPRRSGQLCCPWRCGDTCHAGDGVPARGG